jgi:hypothetical protein
MGQAPPPLGLTGSIGGMPGIHGVGAVGMGAAGLRRIQSSPVVSSLATSSKRMSFNTPLFMTKPSIPSLSISLML